MVSGGVFHTKSTGPPAHTPTGNREEAKVLTVTAHYSRKELVAGPCGEELARVHDCLRAVS